LSESFGRGIVRACQQERRLETPEDDRGNNEYGHQQREHGDQNHEEVRQEELGAKTAGKTARPSLRGPHSHGRRNLYPTPRTVST
jgi:hypothetical protein